MVFSKYIHAHLRILTIKFDFSISKKMVATDFPSSTFFSALEITTITATATENRQARASIQSFFSEKC